MTNDIRIDMKILSSHLFRLIRLKTGKTEAECFLALFKTYSYLINCSNKDGIVINISESFLDDIAGLAGITTCLIEDGRISITSDGLRVIDLTSWMSVNQIRRNKRNNPKNNIRNTTTQTTQNDAKNANGNQMVYQMATKWYTKWRPNGNQMVTKWRPNGIPNGNQMVTKPTESQDLASNTTTQNVYKNVTSSEIREELLEILQNSENAENPLRSIDSSNVFCIEEEENKRKEITPPIVPLYKEKQNYRNVSRNTLNNFSEFQEFWNTYRKKVDRVKCERAFAKLTQTELQAIKEKLPRYVALTPDPQYRKNPLTWINGKCWQDDFEHSINSTQNQNENVLLNQNQMDYSKGFEDL